ACAAPPRELRPERTRGRRVPNPARERDARCERRTAEPSRRDPLLRRRGGQLVRGDFARRDDGYATRDRPARAGRWAGTDPGRARLDRGRDLAAGAGPRLRSGGEAQQIALGEKDGAVELVVLIALLAEP